MNFPLFVARRYLFSKKSTNVINIISVISMTGVMVATAALVIVLSVFNGFHDLVASFFTNIDPQLKVVPVEGKSVAADDPILEKIRQFPQVEVATECVEEQALATFRNRQAMVMLKGVDENFDQLTHISEILLGENEFQLQAANLQYAIPGLQLAVGLGMGAQSQDFLKVYAPKREGQLDMTNPTDGFVLDSLYFSGSVFSAQQSTYDNRYVIVPIAFTRNLFHLQGQLTSLEIRLKEGSDLNKVKKEMRQAAAGRFQVLDRYEQQADTFRIMKIEKLIAYIFLTFILVIACFNIIGSLSMLMIDKRNDVVTLRNIGASDRQISQVFLFEGRMIAAVGAILGIGIGLLACWMQQSFGIIALGSSSGSFIIDAYPVSVHYGDVFLVFITVLVVGSLAAWYPTLYLSRRLLVTEEQSV